MEKDLKPLLPVCDMVEYLKAKNITFKYMLETEATEYLMNNNNYYNVTSYRKNFPKYTSGENVGKFLNLDFAYLKDMAIIDMLLRNILFKMVLDIEHYLKMKILNEIESIPQEDGYRVVNMYLQNDYSSEGRIHESILKKIGNDSYSEILSEYIVDKDNDIIKDVPIWVFLEIITFGDLIKFYEYYSNEYNLEENKKEIFILREVNRLRNAVAHNTCILNSLSISNNYHTIDFSVTEFLNECKISQNMRVKRMRNDRVRQIVYTIYMFDKIVTSLGVRKHIAKELNDFFYDRILHNCVYYQSNRLLCSIYNFFDKILLKVIKKWN